MTRQIKIGSAVIFANSANKDGDAAELYKKKEGVVVSLGTGEVMSRNIKVKFGDEVAFYFQPHELELVLNGIEKAVERL